VEGREPHAPLLKMLIHREGSTNNVKELLKGFLKHEDGQDLIEYTLLLAFVCLASAALFISAGGSVGGIWTTANTDLTTANAAAAS